MTALLEQPPEQFLAFEAGVGAHVPQDGVQRANLEWVVMWCSLGRRVVRRMWLPR